MLKAAIDKGEDINSPELKNQITYRITKQYEMNELLKDEKRTYDDANYEYEHLQEVERKAKLDTIDSQLENKRLAAKVDAINKKPKVRQDDATYLTKLA